MSKITSYHAHVYFNEKSLKQAQELCELITSKFDLNMGRVHEKCLGPHPRWSCQLSFEPRKFGRVIPWLAVNRNGLTVFIHPLTGNDMADHTKHAIWMGEILELNLAQLS